MAFLSYGIPGDSPQTSQFSQMLLARGDAEPAGGSIGYSSSGRLKELSVAVKELIPVVLAVAMFGPHWSGKVIQFKIDNAAVVHVIEITYAQNAHLMYLIRLLIFYASYYNFWFTTSHIPGIMNNNVDALSRNNMAVFFSQVPQATKGSNQNPRSFTSTGITQSNMDIHSLDKALQGYYSAALASSTLKTCKAAERRYTSFCEKFEVPASKSTLCYFVTWLGQECLQHSTIRTYLSGVCQNQIAYGFLDLKFDSMPRLRQILQ